MERYARRQALGWLGAGGAVALVGCSRSGLWGVEAEEGELAGAGGAPAARCVVLPAQTEGPYFTDERLERSDIRSDPLDGTVRPGTPLELTFSVFDASTPECVPVSGALVDLWQCDAAGLYAGVQSLGTAGHEFLRGFQRTSSGVAQFLTIYPGWYPGRTLHLHFKVRHTDASGFVRSFTSQLYFPEPVNDAVMASEPYDARGARSVRNTDDAIFRAGGEALVVPVEPAGTGYTGAVHVGMLL